MFHFQTSNKAPSSSYIYISNFVLLLLFFQKEREKGKIVMVALAKKNTKEGICTQNMQERERKKKLYIYI